MNCNHNLQCKYHGQMEKNVNALQEFLDERMYQMRDNPVLQDSYGRNYQEVMGMLQRAQSILMNGIANWNKGK